MAKNSPAAKVPRHISTKISHMMSLIPMIYLFTLKKYSYNSKLKRDDCPQKVGLQVNEEEISKAVSIHLFMVNIVH